MNPFEDLLGQLHKIKQEHGADAYASACRDVARTMVAQGGQAEEFAREAFAEYLGDEPSASEGPVGAVGNEAVMGALKMGLPHLRSQAQFNAFMAAFDALKVTCDAIFAGDPAAVLRGRTALDKALEVAGQVTEVTNKLDEVPEAAESKLADEFRPASVNPGEYDVQKQLMGELEQIDSLEGLNEWYQSTADLRNKIVSASLRNVLFDAIRSRKAKLS